MTRDVKRVVIGMTLEEWKEARRKEWERDIEEARLKLKQAQKFRKDKKA